MARAFSRSFPPRWKVFLPGSRAFRGVFLSFPGILCQEKRAASFRRQGGKRVERHLRYAGQELILGLTGGLGYYCIELAWRGWSHPSMVAVGGLCFWGMGRLPDRPLWQRALLGAGLITGVEFLSGCVLNLWLRWAVWDYSRLPGNLLGQICLPYSLMWCLLAIPGTALSAAARQHLEGN